MSRSMLLVAVAVGVGALWFLRRRATSRPPVEGAVLSSMPDYVYSTLPDDEIYRRGLADGSWSSRAGCVAFQSARGFVPRCGV
jgi:hypothetical protein